MPRKGISAKTFPGLGKNSQEKQKSSIRWTKSETQLIVDWFCTRNEDGFRVNYDLWTTSSCSSAAERMMNQTGLVFKAGVTKKKAADRMIYMIKLYENLRNKIKQSEWSDGLDGVDGISHEDRKLQIGSYETAKEVILKRCAWYYEYEQLFCDYPGVNPLSLNESDQSTRRGFQVIKDFELGRYDEELEEGESWLQNYGESIACDQDAEEDAVPDNEDESDSFSFYSARSQYERDDSLAAKQRTKNTTGISDDKESLSSSETEITKSNQKQTTPKSRLISSTTTTIESQSHKATASPHTRNERTKRMRSDSPDPFVGETGSKQARKR